MLMVQWLWSGYFMLIVKLVMVWIFRVNGDTGYGLEISC